MFRSIFTVALLLLLAACQTTRTPPSLLERQIEVLQDEGFRQVDDEWQLGLPDRLLFSVDKSELAPEQLRRLHGVARALSEVGIMGARVEGNTDSTGSAQYNRELSFRRAQAVGNALIEGGMNAAAVHPVARGEENPIESNRTAEGRQQNRRVVVIVSTTPVAVDPAPPGAGAP
jgi:OOP family OmpA-OmpF porin